MLPLPLQVLKDFIAVVLPRNVWPAPVTSWSRKWLLRLNGAEQQKKVAKTCPIQTGAAATNSQDFGAAWRHLASHAFRQHYQLWHYSC